MARRYLQRRRTRAYDQVILECAQQAGDRVVSLAFTRFCRPDKTLSGFRAGFDGAPYVSPLGSLDPQKWALGFLEGRSYRGRLP
jgi:hypothetical protein